MRWLIVLLALSAMAHAQVPSGGRADVLREQGTADGFAVAAQPREFVFPRDHGPHPEFRHEWWYVTGNLDGANGERFGFELTVFRFALAPENAALASDQPEAGTAESTGALRKVPAVPGVDAAATERTLRNGPAVPSAASTATGAAAQGASKWRTPQIYMAHFAITDVGRKHFQFGERYARGALGLAGAQAEPFKVWLDDWSLEQRGEAWHLTANYKGYALDIDLQPLLSPVLNGDNGLSRKSSTGSAASYYYSIPRIAVRGKLTQAGKPLDVQGLAWLDREWGSGDLGLQDAGWDWFAIQLADGSALMFYSLRNKNGTVDKNSAGTWVAPDGSTRALKNQDVRLEVLDHWDSPRGGRYPSQWKLSIPSLAFSIDIDPVLPDQELGTNPRYWEGAVNVRGARAGQTIAGRGYVELVGYAQRREQTSSR